MHTFVDGVAVASGLRVSPGLGALVFVAVLLHKFPEGLAISSLFLAAGARRRARRFSAAGALGATTIAGVVLTDALGVPARVRVGDLRRRHAVRRRVESRAGVSGPARARAFR